MENTQAPRVEKSRQKESPFVYRAASLASLDHLDRNEDMIYYPLSARDALWVGVFDGLGGVAGGFFASHMAEEVFRWEIAQLKTSDPDKIEEKLKEIFQKASETLRVNKEVGQTTAVVAKLVERKGEKRAVIASAGDSRAYLARGRVLKRLTNDDSLFSPELLDKFETITSAEVLTEWEQHLFTRRRNIVTQSLGGPQEEPLAVHTYQIKLKPGDILVLSSDGVHDNLTRDEIRQAITIEGDRAKNLVDRARKRSDENHFRAHKDDMSAVVVEVRK